MATNNKQTYAELVAKSYKVGRFTRDIESKYEEQGEQQVKKLIRLVNDGDEAEDRGGTSVGSVHATMKLMQEKENYRIYEMRDEENQLLIMKGVLLLQSSNCDEVMDLFSGSSPNDIREFHYDIFGNLFDSSHMLYHSSTSGESGMKRLGSSSSLSNRSVSVASNSNIYGSQASSLSLQWLALKDLSVHLPVREFLFMRYNQAFFNEDPAATHRVAYGASIWESVDLPGCDPLFNPAAVKRAMLKNCGFVVESSEETDTTRVTFFITTALDQASLQTDRAWLLRVASSVKMIPSAIVNHRIRSNQLKDKSEWDSRDKCALCTTSFTVFKRKHHCRMCGVSICSKCSSIRKDSRNKNGNGIRVCLSCLNGEDTSSLWSQTMGRKMKHGSGDSRDSGASKDSWSSQSMDRSRVSVQSGDSFSSSARISSLDDLLDSDSFSALKLSGKMSAIAPSDLDEDDILENTPFEYSLCFTKGNAWPDAPTPEDENDRLQRIKFLNLSKHFAASKLKELLEFARSSVNAPVAAVAVISASTSLLVTSIGLNGDQLPRDMALESHTVMSKSPLVALDTHNDERFAMNPLVASLNIRFYMGIPLVSKEGITVGSLSLGDTSPREKVNGSDIRSLQRIAARIMDKLDNGAEETVNQSGAQNSSVKGMLLI